MSAHELLHMDLIDDLRPDQQASALNRSGAHDAVLSKTAGNNAFEKEMLRLLSENNRLLNENNNILKSSHDLLLRIDDNIRRIKFNTSG